MNRVIQILIGLAVLAFIAGAVGALVAEVPILEVGPRGYWRGAMGFLAFAITLILLQIRDKS